MFLRTPAPRKDRPHPRQTAPHPHPPLRRTPPGTRVAACTKPTANRRTVMPEQKTIKRAQADKRAGKASSTQAGEFVKEQIDKVRAGKHGVRSARQAIAIGLSEARRAGVAVKSPKKGATSEATRKKAQKDNAAGQRKSTAKKSASSESTAKRSRAATNALKRESTAGASRKALSKQTKSAAANR